MGIDCQNVDIVAVGNIAINSTPTGARIWLKPSAEGTYIDQGTNTNNTITGLVASNYDIRLVLANYQDWTTTVTVTPPDTTTVNATFAGSAYITSTPIGARIWIDGSDMLANTPATVIGLTPVSHNYSLVLAGRDNTTGSFTAIDGQTVNVPVILKTPASITATNITITPSDNPCVAGSCHVDVSVTWINSGESSGTFTPNLTINTILITPAPYDPQLLGAGTEVTLSFVLEGLTADTHIICPSPN